MGITKRTGSPNWYWQKTIDGKKHRLTTNLPRNTYSKAQAKKLMAPSVKEYLEKIRQPKLMENSKDLKVSTMLALYIKDKKREWSDSTKANYPRVCKNFRDYFGSSTLLHTLWLSDRSGTKNLHDWKRLRYQDDVVETTINTELDVIKSAYNHIKDNYAIYKLGKELNKSHWKSLREIEPDQPDRSIELDDFFKIFFALPPHAQNVVWFSLIGLGVRKLNVTGLNYNQIKGDKIEFWVKSKKKRRINNQIVSGKIHNVPITDDVYNLLTGQKLYFETEENHQARAKCLNLTGVGNLFLYNGKPFKDPKKTWGNTQKRLGITRIGKNNKLTHKYTIHGVRHTVGSIVGSELGDDYAMRTLGHSTMQVTRNYNKKDMQMKIVGMKKIQEVVQRWTQSTNTENELDKKPQKTGGCLGTRTPDPLGVKKNTQ